MPVPGRDRALCGVPSKALRGALGDGRAALKPGPGGRFHGGHLDEHLDVRDFRWLLIDLRAEIRVERAAAEGAPDSGARKYCAWAAEEVSSWRRRDLILRSAKLSGLVPDEHTYEERHDELLDRHGLRVPGRAPSRAPRGTGGEGKPA